MMTLPGMDANLGVAQCMGLGGGGGQSLRGTIATLNVPKGTPHFQCHKSYTLTCHYYIYIYIHGNEGCTVHFSKADKQPNRAPCSETVHLPASARHDMGLATFRIPPGPSMRCHAGLFRFFFLCPRPPPAYLTALRGLQ